MSSSQPPCVHEVINEADAITKAHSEQEAAKVDQLGAAVRDYLTAVAHVEANDPQVLEGLVAGLALAALRVDALVEQEKYDPVELEVCEAALCVLGQLTQAVAGLYLSPPCEAVPPMTVVLPPTATPTPAGSAL